MKYFKMISVWFTLVFSATFIFQNDLFMHDIRWEYVLPMILVFTITCCTFSWVIKTFLGSVGLVVDRLDPPKGSSLPLMWIVDIASIWLALVLTEKLIQVVGLNWWANIIFALCISVVGFLFDTTKITT